MSAKALVEFNLPYFSLALHGTLELLEIHSEIPQVTNWFSKFTYSDIGVIVYHY
jgi:hypothetical protein